VKRDDELSCGISGTKLRKYASIVPFIRASQIQHLIIIAGPQSNNLLAALQVARELNLKVTAFLLQPKSTGIQGNFKLSLLFLNSEDIVWVNRTDWNAVDDLACEYAQTLNEKSFVLQEGASVPQALNGAMSLAYDIKNNEDQLGIPFEHVFIDAGTGFSAAGLIHGLNELNHTGHVHVLLLADEESVFDSKMQGWLGYIPERYSCFYPTTARSFGSVNQKIKHEIRRLALEEGILADPIYSAKLFHESRRFLVEQNMKKTSLIIHSGGLLTMAGFDL
jgi:1-aminocyclopropane-1-carboxylate deaminase/D-cysteine desulfhydrase-like pyridoxal-dependent ACC family enzyme